MTLMVTHGATIIASVEKARAGSGISFHAGEGVGTVTRAGLPIPVGEAAINPVPRKLMTEVVESLCRQHETIPDIRITISVPGGEKNCRAHMESETGNCRRHLDSWHNRNSPSVFLFRMDTFHTSRD